MNLFTKKFHFSPITFRMTLWLTLFALMISYVSITMSAVVISHRFIEKLGKAVLNNLEISGINSDGPIQDSLLGKRNSDFAGALNLLRKNLSDYKVALSINFFDSRGNIWRELRHDERSLFYAVPVSADMAEDLVLKPEKRVVTTSGLFLGKSSRASVLINTYTLSHENGFVIRLDAERDGILLYIKQNIPHVAGFALLLALLSFLISRHLARRITRPVIEIAQGASAVASGDYSYQFEVKSKDEIGTLASSLNVMTTSISDHITEVESRMKAMETMNLIDKAVLSSVSRKDLLDRVTGIVSSLFNTDSITLALRNRDRAGFDIISFYHEGAARKLSEKPFIPDSELDASFLNRVTTMFQVTDKKEIKHMPAIFRDTIAGESSPVLNIPINMSGTYSGSLGIASRQRSGFAPDEMETARMLADQVGVALQSVMANEERENLLLGILLALTRSIDAKSRWTAGHSERVARYVEFIARAMNYDENSLMTLNYSAILHDIGKIAVPETILDKPSSLTDEEYNIVKEHPSIGAGIIADIPSYDAILPGILYHHERWDGSGYPEGLSGDDIPVFGRIMAVADVYDAITAERPYRSGMTEKDAILFIKEKSGTMFDPEITALFLEILNSGAIPG